MEKRRQWEVVHVCAGGTEGGAQLPPDYVYPAVRTHQAGSAAYQNRLAAARRGNLFFAARSVRAGEDGRHRRDACCSRELHGQIAVQVPSVWKSVLSVQCTPFPVAPVTVSQQRVYSARRSKNLSKMQMPWRSRSQLWLCLVLGGAFGNCRQLAACVGAGPSEPTPNYILGTV